VTGCVGGELCSGRWGDFGCSCSPAGHRSHTRPATARQYKPLPTELQNWGFYRLVLVYTLGFCLTNGAFGAVNASLVDTVKAGEPIATVILTLLFLPGEKVTLPIFLSLLPIVAGVGVSSMSDASFQLLGLAMAMGSAACSKGRAPWHTAPPHRRTAPATAMLSQP
jgi:drug/metabolite transporter (DMT)-like permease